MKVTCDNCSAVYRIPEEKLTKDVSRATCKKCGNKIVIRKPSSSLSDAGLGSNYAFDDDDSIINHEERTVIASVPELQRFDATPPLSVPGAGGESADDLDTMESAEAAPAPQAAPAARPAAPSPAAPAAAMSQEASAPRPSGVPIPSQMKLEIGVAPLALVAVGIVGTLLFVPDWLWSTSRLSAAGFGLALYAQIAVFMALLDIRAQRAPRPQLVFTVPAVVCVVVFLLLLMFQGKTNMAFLNVGRATVATVVEGDGSALDGVVYEEVEVVDEATGKRRIVRRQKQRQPDLARSSSTTMPGLQNGAVAAINDPTGRGANPSNDALVALGAGGRDTTGPNSNIESQRVNLHEQKLSARDVSNIINNDSGVERCFRQFGAGLSGSLIYEVTLLPAGKVKYAHFEKSSTYRESDLEQCINEAVGRLSFPQFAGDKAETVAHKFIFDK